MTKLLEHQARLTFLGAASTVTGSKTLLEYKNSKVLVDCGMFQGLKELRNLNRAPFIVDPKSIDVILLTHAHLDHCGFIPVLVKNGFKGEIHCTKATLELAEIILKDSAKIQEEDANRANRYNYSKHSPAKPLYTQDHVRASLELFVAHDFNEWVIINNDIKFNFLSNGHILGSAFLQMKVDQKEFLFSGDMGQLKPVLLYPPKKVKSADYIVMESTYGDRLHENGDTKKELLRVIESTYEKRGILMIPSFAVERTQEILYMIYQLRKEGKLPNMPVYLDSPMGIHATKVYDRYHELQNISNFEINRMYDDVSFIDDYEASKRVCLDNKPKIILAGSGMIEGGRIIHYLNNHMGNKRNTLLFVGYQGEGTRGRAILNGSKEIKFFGKYHKVMCDIESISHLSAHADQADIISWLKNIQNTPQKVFLNHGEKHQAEALCVKIQHEFNWDCSVPKMYEEYILPTR
jgi:metallo-beta-lactamase family protein